MKLLQADPTDTNVRLKIADLYMRMKSPEQALASYNEVAEIFTREGFDAKAVAVYKQILGVYPDSLDARVRLGDLYQRLGLVSEALREYQSAVRLCQVRGLKREAFDLLKRIAQLDPSNVANRLSLAHLLEREGMRDEARSEYESILCQVERGVSSELRTRVATQMLQSFPGHSSALRVLARAQIEAGDATTAIKLLEQALPGQPEDLALRETLVELYRQRGDEEGAQGLYREIAELYRLRGDVDRARDILQRFVPSQAFAEPETPPSMVTRGQKAEPRRFAPQAAPQVATEFSPAGAGLPEPASDDRLSEARIALDYGSLDDAEARAMEILAADATSDGARAVLATVALRRGDLAGAERLHEERRQLAAAAGDAGLLLLIEEDLQKLRAQAQGESPPPPLAPALDLHADEPPSEPELLLVREPDPLARVQAPPERVPAPPEPRVQTPELRVQAPELRVQAPEPRVQAPELRVPLPEPRVHTPPDIESLPDVEIVLDDGEDDRFASIEPPAGLFSSGGRRDEFEIDLGGISGLEIFPPAPPPEPAGAAAPSPASVASKAPAPGPASVVTKAATPSPPSVVAKAAAPSPPSVVAKAAAPSPPGGATRKPSKRSEQSGSSWASDSTFVAERLEDAERLYARGDFSAAEALYQTIVHRAPRHPQALLRLGEIAAMRGEPPELVEGLEETLVDDRPAGDEGDLDLEIPEPRPVLEPPSLEVPPKRVRPSEPRDLASARSAAAFNEISSVETTTAPGIEPLEDFSDLAAELDEPTPTPDEGDEGDFDLAAELAADWTENTDPQSGGLDSILRAFKRGIEEQLSDDDLSARYDLGIAYREMGLHDDAIAELALAASGGPRRIEALAALATTKLDLGRPVEAVDHLREALELAGTAGPVALALRYDLGLALAAAGERAEALRLLRGVAAEDRNFREVTARIEELTASWR